jgi:hypothetical protein
MQVDMLGIFHSRCDANHLYSLVVICCRFCLVTSLVWKKYYHSRLLLALEYDVPIATHIFWVI